MHQPVPEIVDVKRLDHLPLVGAVLRFLEVKDTIDQLVPADPRHEVTAGECVEALVVMILTGEHALYRVSETLASYDLEIIFQRPMAAEHFHDNRLGHVLDALWEVGLDRVYGAVISQAIRAYALDLSRLHSDTTSLKVYGAYEREEEEEGPLITFGFSKDHRPDLKQLLFGLTVTADGAVPVWGHITDGNRSDSEEHRFHITQLRRYLPDLTHPLLVADSKFFAGQTLFLAQAERLSFVTLVPKTVGLQRTLVEEMELEAMPVLLERPGRRSGTVEVSRGRSVLRTYQAQTARGEPQELLLRFLVVESTQLAKHNGPRLAAAIQAERARLSELAAEWGRREFACEADARQALAQVLQQARWRYHRLSGRVSQEAVKAKRPTRGRPRKGESPPLHQVWRVRLQVQERAEVIATEGRRARCFVLATNVLDPQRLSDAGVLQAYKGQPAVELSFKWAKNPAAIAPIFLKKPSRIAALGCLYLIALMVYTLIERQVRNRLAETGETLPDRPKPTQRPTARTVFRLMRGIAVVILARGGQFYRHVTTLGSHQLQVIRLLGFDRAIYGHLRENPG